MEDALRLREVARCAPLRRTGRLARGGPLRGRGLPARAVAPALGRHRPRCQRRRRLSLLRRRPHPLARLLPQGLLHQTQVWTKTLSEASEALQTKVDQVTFQLKSVWVFFFHSPPQVFNHRADADKADLLPWVSSRHNMGMAFNRSLWTQLHRCADLFCSVDDYNWDWSLSHVAQKCLPGLQPRRPDADAPLPPPPPPPPPASLLSALVLRAPRVFHIGEWSVALVFWTRFPFYCHVLEVDNTSGRFEARAFVKCMELKRILSIVVVRSGLLGNLFLILIKTSPSLKFFQIVIGSRHVPLRLCVDVASIPKETGLIWPFVSTAACTIARDAARATRRR